MYNRIHLKGKMKNILVLLTVVFASIFILGCGGNVPVTIVNDLGAWNIEEIYIYPFDEARGENQISEMLVPGKECTITIPAGTYDIMLLDEDGDSYTRSGIAIGSDGYDWVVTLSEIESSEENGSIEHAAPQTHDFPDSVYTTVDVGEEPRNACSLPSGEYVYVTNYEDNNVSVISTFDNSVVATVELDGNPRGICALPSGEYVYVVAHSRDHNITVIRTSDNSVVAKLDVGNWPQPEEICALPSGKFVYATSSYARMVSVIRTSDNSVVATIEGVGSYNPGEICSLPSGEYVYVANSTDDVVSVIRTSDNSVVATIDVGYQPISICCLPSGEYVYVVNNGEHSVSVIRTSDNSVVATIKHPKISNPIDICVLPSGDYMYVPNLLEEVVIIRTSDNSVISGVYVDSGSFFLGLTGICALPSGETLYVVNGGYGHLSVIQ